MIVSDRFVFLHLHKSGGSFVNRFLLESLPSARQIGYHLPRECIPEPARALPILGTVRNPWDYYVSWYSFQQAKAAPNALFELASDDRRLGFAGTIGNLMRLGEDAPLLDAWASRLPDVAPNRGINLTRADVAPLRESGVGFYSFLYRRMYGDLSRTTLLETARLRAGLQDFLMAVGVDVTPSMQTWLARQPPINASAHAHYGGFYDPALRDLVAEKDADVIQRHGFSFETAAGR
jgi:hypothetical protein